ncbi:unnamed protein product [Prunus armeniaca]
MHSPSEDHLATITRILSYLKKALCRGLIFRKLRHLNVKGYTNADWASNIIDRHSTSGYFTFIGNVVARSLVDAEYKGIAHEVCGLLWLRILLSEIDFPPKKANEFYCDNQVARDIENNLVYNGITKHVEVDSHFIKKKLVDKLINIPVVKS